MKKSIFPILIASLLLFAAAAQGESGGWIIRQQLEQASLQPADHSGFRLALCVDQVDLRTTATDGISEDGRVCYFDLSETECRSLLENAIPVSIGPQGAVLWAAGEDRSFIVQRDHTLVALAQSPYRGARDSAKTLEQTLDQKRIIHYPSQIVNGDTRWSPDGRYVFLNESGKWNFRFEVDDPFLADTFTGEIFLIETDGKEKVLRPGESFQYIETGRFSREENAFYYVLKTGSLHILKRYDLATGALTECYQTDSRIDDFCECGLNRWAVFETQGNDIRIVRLSKDGNRYRGERELLRRPAMTSQISVIPVSGELALIHCTFLSAVSCFLPFRWDQPTDRNGWYMITEFSHSGLQLTDPEEIDRRCLINSPHAYTGVDISGVSSLAAVDSSPRVLCNIHFSRLVPDSWKNMTEQLYGFLYIDAETLTLEPVCCFEVNEFTGPSDQTVYTDTLLLEAQPYRFADKETPAVHADSLTPDTIYSCSNGTYRWDGRQELTACYITTRSTEVKNTISASGTGYRIGISFTPTVYNTYIVPEVMTQERFEIVMANMAKKDVRKTSGNYILITPETLKQREDKAELTACYPGLLNQNMYVLKRDTSENQLRSLEKYFAGAGYTGDDYETDRTEVAKSFRFDEKTYPVSYAFDQPDGLPRAEMLRLAGLCDRIGSAVYHSRYEEPAEEIRTTVKNQTAQDIIQGRTEKKTDGVTDLIPQLYEADGVLYRIAVENMEDSETSLSLTLFVECENRP